MDAQRARRKEAVLDYLQEARTCAARGEHGKAYAFYLLVLRLAPQLGEAIKADFCETWDMWSTKLMRLERFEDLVNLYEQGCECFDDCCELHVTMAACYYRMGHKYGAFITYKRALKADPQNICARECMDNLSRELMDNWHYMMLNDKRRNELFSAAISECIQKCKEANLNVEVLDIGSGTGILSMLAARSGADKVTACEMCPILSEIGKQAIDNNGFGEKIKSLTCKSTDLTIESNFEMSNSTSSAETSLSRRFEVVISETLDGGALGEGIVKTVDHAWKNLLMPAEQGGVVIPVQVTLKCCCLQSEDIYRRHSGTTLLQDKFIVTSGTGIDSNSCPENGEIIWASGDCAEPYTSERVANLRHQMLSDYAEVIKIDFNDPEQISELASQRKELVVKIRTLKSGYLDAIVVCFALALDKGENPKYVIDTEIGSDFCWEQAVYPIRDLQGDLLRLAVQENDLVTLHITIHHDRLVLESCEVQSRKYHQAAPTKQSAERTLLVLKEQDVALFNDRSLVKAYCEAFQNWLHGKDGGEEGCNASAVPPDLSLRGISLNGDVTNREANHVMHVGILHANRFSDAGEHRETQEASNKPNCHSSGEKQYHLLELSSGFTSLTQEIYRRHWKVQTFSVLRQTGAREAFSRLSSGGLEVGENVPRERNFDVVFVLPIEPSGLLQQHLVEDILIARSHKTQGGIIFPTRLKMMAMLIDSTDLQDRCSVRDENTLGLHIGKYINKFQTTTCPDMNMRTLKYKALSDAVAIVDMDFNNASPDLLLDSREEKVIKAVADGTATALLTWFIIEVDGYTTLSTLDEDNHWRQSAIVFKKSCSLRVRTGEELALNARRHLSYVSVDISCAAG